MEIMAIAVDHQRVQNIIKATVVKMVTTQDTHLILEEVFQDFIEKVKPCQLVVEVLMKEEEGTVLLK